MAAYDRPAIKYEGGMKILGSFLFAFGAMSMFVGFALMTARGRPPEWHNWWWRAGSVQITVEDQRVVRFYREDRDGGLVTTTLVLWPPAISGDYMAKQYRDWLGSSRDWTRSGREHDEFLTANPRPEAAAHDTRDWRFP